MQNGQEHHQQYTLALLQEKDYSILHQLYGSPRQIRGKIKEKNCSWNLEWPSWLL